MPTSTIDLTSDLEGGYMPLRLPGMGDYLLLSQKRDPVVGPGGAFGSWSVRMNSAFGEGESMFGERELMFQSFWCRKEEGAWGEGR